MSFLQLMNEIDLQPLRLVSLNQRSSNQVCILMDVIRKT